jgi:hypothetical protein
METMMQQAARLALRYDPPGPAGGAGSRDGAAAAAGAATAAGVGGGARCGEAQYNPVARRAAGVAPASRSDSDSEEEQSLYERQASAAARRMWWAWPLRRKALTRCARAGGAHARVLPPPRARGAGAWIGVAARHALAQLAAERSHAPRAAP